MMVHPFVCASRRDNETRDFGLHESISIGAAGFLSACVEDPYLLESEKKCRADRLRRVPTQDKKARRRNPGFVSLFVGYAFRRQ
jgi:hypothetical protein